MFIFGQYTSRNEKFDEDHLWEKYIKKAAAPSKRLPFLAPVLLLAPENLCNLPAKPEQHTVQSRFAVGCSVHQVRDQYLVFCF